MDEGKFFEAARADRIAIGRSIVKAREGRGMTSSELADHIGMDRSNFHNIEAGTQNVTLETLTRIRVALSMRYSVRFVDGARSEESGVRQDNLAIEDDSSAVGEPPVTPP